MHMADDLELAVRSIDGEGPSTDFVVTLRERLLAEAAAPTASRSDEAIVGIELQPQEHEERATKYTRWILAGAAAVIALLVGLVAVTGDDDTIRTQVATTDATEPTTVEPSVVPDTTAPATIAAPESAGTPGADADAGCGLSDSASVLSTVDASGESVTIDVMSDPSCSGVDVRVVATPWVQGFPIEKTATLDDTGAASVTDHLLSTRKARQNWTVELLVSGTGGVAATGDFAVTEFCDLEAADLQAEHLPETNEVSIVLTVDPACAGETFTFDRDGIFASSPPGGWATYTVDDDGRVEVIEQLVVSGPIIDVWAVPVAEERGINTGGVARVTLDIGG